MKRRAGRASLGTSVVSAVLLSGCAGGHLGLANSDIPSDLGLQSDPSAFNLVAGGAGLVEPITVTKNTKCSLAFHGVFIPPGRSGEAAGGEGVTFTYPEVLTIEWQCPSTEIARMVFAERSSEASSEGARAVAEVADEATLLSVGNEPNQGYPADRVYIVGWREGEYFGGVQLVGPQGDELVTPAVAESLARREASDT